MEYQGVVQEMPKKVVDENPNLYMEGTCVVALRLPRGHWNALVIHCQKLRLTKKAALMAMIEGFVGKEDLAFAYAKPGEALTALKRIKN